MRALVGILVGLWLVADPSAAWSRGRRTRHRWPRRLRVAALPLPPTWTSTTDGVEVAPDAPEDDVRPRGGLRPSRVKGAVTKAACLRELRRLRIPFKIARPKATIWLAVRITGPMFGVTYEHMYSKHKPLVDCQFSLGLYRAAKVLKRFGVEKLRYTSTYRSPPRRRWRTVGHHPQGLAMDVNEVVFKSGKRLVLVKDWEKFYGGPGHCVGRVKTKDGALLRRIACALEKAHIFKRLISPDGDLAHHNHWHISGARIGESFVRTRWAGRTLTQPLPGTKGFRRWYRWYSCWKIRSPRRRWRCYRRRARRKPRAPVRYKRPPYKPRVAIWLKSQVRPSAEPPSSAKAVNLPPERRHAHPAVRPRRRR